MNDDLICSKCDGPMVSGFVLDRGHRNDNRESEWVEGSPSTDPATESFGPNLELQGRLRFFITTYRCADCGYLESYALRSGHD